MLVPTLESQRPLDLKRQIQRAVSQRRDLIDQFVNVRVAAMSRVHLARPSRGRPRLQGSRRDRRERRLHPLGDLLIAEPAVAARVAECTIGGGVPCVEPLRCGGP